MRTAHPQDNGLPAARRRRLPAATMPLTMLLLATVSLLQPLVASANGVPVTLILSYLDGVSNWGPRNATGISEFIARESELRVSATGLTQLAGEEYRVWIKNATSGQQMSLATFNATPDGKVNLDVLLDMTIPDGGWNLMFVSVEAEGSKPATPSGRIALAGRWPVPSTADGRPGELPRTGGLEPLGINTLLVGGLGLVLGLVAMWFVGVRYGRRVAAGRTR